MRIVLVPFDIGVVYILSRYDDVTTYCFSPLRYWGSLYHKIHSQGHILEFQSPSILGQSISELADLIAYAKVLVPFDIGVVYIKFISSSIFASLFQSPSILGQSISILKDPSDSRIVLVPFDIGVVYINSDYNQNHS